MDLKKLTTETRNKNTMNLDTMSSLEIVRIMNNEDALIPLSIREALPEIAKLVDYVADAFKNGHRLFYIGAGTSGRLGVLDASECPPTFGVPNSMVVGLIAGGDTALRNPVENAEDRPEFGVEDLKKHNLEKGDIVVGLAASGRTPYVIGGLDYANSLGCTTGCIICNKSGEMLKHCDIKIAVDNGPEILTGSTRLKSGTSQKMIINMITTSSMVLIGKTYQNLMVDVIQSNKKLITRAENIFIEATGASRDDAKKFIDKANGKVKTAIVMYIAKCDINEANIRLKKSKGHTRGAINL